jgi:large subunit ribosomal protein L10e
MRQAYGKPTGTVARVEIGQILFSVRSRDNNEKQVIEALRRAKYKFPGRQHIIVSSSWGFTPFTRAEYQQYQSEGRLIQRGAHAVKRSATGRLNGDSILVQASA